MINIIQKLIQYDLGTRSTHSIVVIILSVSLLRPPTIFYGNGRIIYSHFYTWIDSGIRLAYRPENLAKCMYVRYRYHILHLNKSVITAMSSNVSMHTLIQRDSTSNQTVSNRPI